MDVLIVIFAIAGLVWALVVLQRGGLLGACLAELLVAACLGYHFHRFMVGSVPLTIDRLLLVALCGLYLLYRWKGWADPKPAGRADFALLALLVLLTLNTLAHDWQYNRFQPVSDLVLYFWGPAAVYWIARQSPLSDARLRMFANVLAVFSLYLALTALAEALDLSALTFPSYISTGGFAGWQGRAKGPFLSPPTNGLYLGTSLCVWMMYWPRAGRLGRAAILAAIGLVSFGLYLTLTRACWLGAVVGVWVVLLLAVPARWRAGFVAASLLVGLAAVPVVGGRLIGLHRGSAENAFVTEQSARLRPVIAAVEWAVFTRHPLFGCGYGNYLKVHLEYLRNSESSLPLDMAKGYSHHNMFLAILTETGITGLACYLAVFGLWAAGALRLWRGRGLPLPRRQQGLLCLGYLANLFVLGVFHNVNVDVHIALLTFLMAGVTQGAACCRNATSLRREQTFSAEFRGRAGCFSPGVTEI